MEKKKESLGDRILGIVEEEFVASSARCLKRVSAELSEASEDELRKVIKRAAKFFMDLAGSLGEENIQDIRATVDRVKQRLDARRPPVQSIARGAVESTSAPTIELSEPRVEVTVEPKQPEKGKRRGEEHGEEGGDPEG